MSSIHLTADQIEEIKKCHADPVYFVETFCWLEEKETRRILPFNPFPYQRRMLEWMQDGENILALKDRRVGCSWITAAFAAWLMNFYRGANCLFLSKREEDAKKLLKKVKFTLNNLAYHDADEHVNATKANWLRNEIITDNQQNFTTGFRGDDGQLLMESESVSLTTTSESGRSEGASLIFLDEFAFVKPDDEATWTAIKPTVARGGQWIMVSTPRGVGGVFHRLCMEAERSENKSYRFLEVNWWEAGMTQEQVDAAMEGLDVDMATQEWGHQFIQSGSPVFSATDLAACYKPLDEYPQVAIELQKYHKEIGFYYSGVDSAVGKAHRKERLKDYNSWTSLTKTGLQACAYHKKEPLSKWAGHQITQGGSITNILGTTSRLHAKYPGLAKVEENGPGQTVLNRHVIPADGESNIFPGHTNAPTKARLINNLKLAIEAHDIVITDLFTYQCLMVYQNGNVPGQYEAPSGYNDDPVVSLALANDLRFEYGSMEFEWPDGAPVRRSMSEDDMHQLDVEEAPLGPDIQAGNIFWSEFMPGPGRAPDTTERLPIPDLSLMPEPDRGEPDRIREREREKNM